jgi:hypothetical protein
VLPIAGGLRLPLGLSRLDVLSPAEVLRRYGSTAPAPDRRTEVMAVLTFRTADLARTAAALAEGGIPGVVRHADRLLVPASETFGVTLEFRQ